MFRNSGFDGMGFRTVPYYWLSCCCISRVAACLRGLPKQGNSTGTSIYNRSCGTANPTCNCFAAKVQDGRLTIQGISRFPSSTFCPLSFWGPLLNQNSRTKNTLIITGLLEEPRYVYTEGLWVPRFDLTRQCSCLQSAASGSAQTLCAVNLHLVHSYIHT